MSREADARTSAMESRDGPFSPDVQTRRPCEPAIASGLRWR
jgi:hypothetical protein